MSMVRSFNINKSAKQLMIFNPISKTIKDADNIRGAMRANNTEMRLFNMISYFYELVFSSNREGLVPEETKSGHVHAPLLSEQADK